MQLLKIIITKLKTTDFFHALNRWSFLCPEDVEKIQSEWSHRQTKQVLSNHLAEICLVGLSLLDYYGIRGSTHKWISSWLSGRSQQVVLDGQASDPVPVLSGVPQGSVLGPILFLIFINDLPDNIKSSVCLFADDCVLYRNIDSLQDCLILQEDLDSLGLWEADWQRHCLRVRYRTSRLRGYGSGTGPLDTDSRGPVPDPEPRL